MASHQCNQTRPKNRVFLFLAVSRADMQDKPHREQVTAYSEREARSMLAGHFILCFAGRLPVQGRSMTNLISLPLPASADLFQAGDMCGQFVARLTDENCVDDVERFALCGRLAYALRSLTALCDADYPPHIQAQLTAAVIPAPACLTSGSTRRS